MAAVRFQPAPRFGNLSRPLCWKMDGRWLVNFPAAVSSGQRCDMSEDLWHLSLCFSLTTLPAKPEGNACPVGGHYYCSNRPEHDTLCRADQKNICAPDPTLPTFGGIL